LRRRFEHAGKTFTPRLGTRPRHEDEDTEKRDSADEDEGMESDIAMDEDKDMKKRGSTDKGEGVEDKYIAMGEDEGMEYR